MSLPVIATVFLVIIAIGYFKYGTWVARQFDLDPGKITPAHYGRNLRF